MSDYSYSFYDPNEGKEMQYTTSYSVDTQYGMYQAPTPVYPTQNARRQQVMEEKISPSPYNPFHMLELQREYNEYNALMNSIKILDKGMSPKSVDRVQIDRIIIPSSMLTPSDLLEYNEDAILKMKTTCLAQLQNIPQKMVELLEKAKAEKTSESNMSHTIECYKRLKEWIQSWKYRLIIERPEGYYWNAVAIKNFHEQYMS